MNLIKKILEKFKKNDYKNTSHPKKNFRSLMTLAEINLKDRSDSEKITMLDYIIDILKVDICSSGIIEPFIIQPTEPYLFPFPNKVYDENGNSIDGHCGEKEVNLKKTDIFVRPWNVERQLKNILNLKDKEFVYDKNNHYSYYYNITTFYSHCHTDGIYWYNSHTNDIIYDVHDFRLAAIYELAKKRYFIRNNIN